MRISYFEDNKDRFSQQEEVQASHILAEDEETANEVMEKLNEEEALAELAAEYSTDSTAESGGELGCFGKGEIGRGVCKSSLRPKNRCLQ